MPQTSPNDKLLHRKKMNLRTTPSSFLYTPIKGLMTNIPRNGNVIYHSVGDGRRVQPL